MKGLEMGAVLRLVEMDRTMSPTMSPAPLSTTRPSLRPTLRASLRPTLVPSSHTTLHPSCIGRISETPTTQRSATVHPRFDAAARHDARNMLAVMRLNVDFLESLLAAGGSSVAADALEDIHHVIQRLERRFG